MASSRQSCPYDVAFDNNGNVVLLYCGKWACKRCAKQNARVWSWRVRLHIANEDRRWYFITFTLAGTVKSASEGYSKLPKLWRKLRRYMLEAAKPSTWQYVAFVEGQLQRFGMPHFHIISSVGCPGRVKDFAAFVGFGYMAMQTTVSGDDAASYCAKYASKGDPHMPKNFRRVRASHGWTKLPERDFCPYIVRNRREKVADYIVRVHEMLDLDMDEVSQRYFKACQKLDKSVSAE